MQKRCTLAWLANFGEKIKVMSRFSSKNFLDSQILAEAFLKLLIPRAYFGQPPLKNLFVNLAFVFLKKRISLATVVSVSAAIDKVLLRQRRVESWIFAFIQAFNLSNRCK